MISLSSILLKLTFGLSRWIGRQHWPFTHKQITHEDCEKALAVLHSGDIILSRIDGELSNLFIPGEWKHAALYCESKKEGQSVIEAVGAGVIQNDFFNFAFKKDAIAVFRPLFADWKQMRAAAESAEALIGAPYDYEFSTNNKAFYCSELIFAVYKRICKDSFQFELRERLGSNTIVPQDIANASKVFQLIWQSGDYKDESQTEIVPKKLAK